MSLVYKFDFVFMQNNKISPIDLPCEGCYGPEGRVFCTHCVYLMCRVCSESCSVISESFSTPWTAAQQAPLPVGFPRQEHWRGLPSPSPDVWGLETSVVLPHIN